MIYELACLEKAMLLIPLSKKVSRGDQIENAAYFQSQGYALTLDESNLNEDTFIEHIFKLFKQKTHLQRNLKRANFLGASQRIVDLIQNFCQ